MVAFAILVAVAVAEAVLLSAGRSWRGYRWAALGVVLVASALSIFSLPEGAVTTAADWAFGTVGWFLLILLLNQPLAWLLTALGSRKPSSSGRHCPAPPDERSAESGLRFARRYRLPTRLRNRSGCHAERGSRG